MPKINPDDYDDCVRGYDDIVYDGCEDEYDGTDIFGSDLDIESELKVWKRVRQWGHPHISQHWDKDRGLVFECRIWFGFGINTVECTATESSIEDGLISLLVVLGEEVFKICDSVKK